MAAVAPILIVPKGRRLRIPSPECRARVSARLLSLAFAAWPTGLSVRADRSRASSSAGQSARLISVRSEVQILPGPLHRSDQIRTQRSAIRAPISAGSNGGVAQLGERLLCKQEVIGSIPFTSTDPTNDQRVGWIGSL